MEQQVSLDHYLLRENPSIIAKLKEEILAGKKGLFLIGEIKNFGFLKNYFSNKIIKTITLEMQNKLQSFFPDYLFFLISEKYFAVIITDVVLDDVQEIVENIQQLAEISKITDHTIHVATSFGVTIFPDDSNNAEDIFAKAYLAVKNITIEDQRGYLFFYEFIEQQASFIKNMNIANKLKMALQENRIFLMFQPVVDSKTYQIIYHEALLRMENYEDEIYSIGDYIEVAEKFHFINSIDELILDLVVKELTEYREIKLSMNVSAYTIGSIAWMKKAKILLSDKQIGSRLIIEITETIAHKDFQKSIKFIENLQALNCKISLDDFGSGYTSFSQLKILPIDIVKIDGIFIKDIMTNHNNEFFVKSVVELNKALNRIVVAEFVESEEIAIKLKDLGIDELQGYFFGEPSIITYWRK